MTDFFFRVNGEMAALTNAFDWSKTSLGDKRTWSISLRTQINLMLSSRFPMLIFWGPDLIMLYNDAFRPSLGENGKHPSSLGEKGEISWAELWPTIGPLLRGILSGGEAVWSENQKLPLYRNGEMSYAYWTYSYSPLIDDDGERKGVLVTCQETTHAVENLQRLKESEIQLEKSQQSLLASFQESPVAIAIISTDNLVFRMANRFYAELVGRTEEQLVGKSLHEAMPELAGQGFDRLLRQVISSGIPFISPETGVDIVRNGVMERIYVNLSYQPMRDPDAVVTGILVVATNITYEVRSRLAIEESENRFRTLIEVAPVGIALFRGENFIIELANETILAQWRRGQEVIGKTILEAIPEIINQSFPELVRKVYDTGQPYRESAKEARLMVEGVLSTHYFDISYTPLFDKNGNVYAILDILIDVTHTVLSGRKLQQSEAFTKTIFYNSPVAKMVLSGAGLEVREVNEQMLQLFNAGEEIVGWRLADIFPTLAQSKLIAGCRDVLKSGILQSASAVRLDFSRNGAERSGYFDYTIKALPNPEGVITDIMVTVINVTEKVTAQQTLHESEERLQNAVELAELGTWIIDLNTETLDLSSRMREWLGLYDTDADVRQVLDRVNPAEFVQVTEALQKVLDGTGHERFDEVFGVLNRENGSRRFLHAQAHAIRDSHGKITRVLGTAQDITLQREVQTALENEVQQRTIELAASNEELSAINEELEEFNVRLSHSNEELAQFAYVASHDLQEPLRKIRIYSSMVLSDNDLQDASRTNVVKISQSAERMSLLISDLLAFSRLAASDSLFTEVDLNRTVQSVWNDFEITVSETKATLTVEPLPVIEGIALQINQLCYNLVSNALKFIRKGQSPQLRISAGFADQATIARYIVQPLTNTVYYAITFADDGIGFEPEHAEQIFEVFKRLHTRDVYSGSGIGLALCRRITINHNGFLFAIPNTPSGSSFVALLPARQSVLQ